jgi:hypothetical protein
MSEKCIGRHLSYLQLSQIWEYCKFSDTITTGPRLVYCGTLLVIRQCMNFTGCGQGCVQGCGQCVDRDVVWDVVRGLVRVSGRVVVRGVFYVFLCKSIRFSFRMNIHYNLTEHSLFYIHFYIANIHFSFRCSHLFVLEHSLEHSRFLA